MPESAGDRGEFGAELNDTVGANVMWRLPCDGAIRRPARVWFFDFLTQAESFGSEGGRVADFGAEKDADMFVESAADRLNEDVEVDGVAVAVVQLFWVEAVDTVVVWLQGKGVADGHAVIVTSVLQSRSGAQVTWAAEVIVTESDEDAE